MAQQKKRKRQRKVGSLASVGVNTKIRRDRNGKFVNKAGVNKSRGSNAKNLRKYNSRPATANKTVVAHKANKKSNRTQNITNGAIIAGAVALGAYAAYKSQGSKFKGYRQQRPASSPIKARTASPGEARASKIFADLGSRRTASFKGAKAPNVKSGTASKTYSAADRAPIAKGPKKVKTATPGSVDQRANAMVARARRSANNPGHQDRIHKARMAGHSIKFGAMVQSNNRSARSAAMIELSKGKRWKARGRVSTKRRPIGFGAS